MFISKSQFDNIQNEDTTGWTGGGDKLAGSGSGTP